jgi:hypothetical protein
MDLEGAARNVFSGIVLACATMFVRGSHLGDVWLLPQVSVGVSVRVGTGYLLMLLRLPYCHNASRNAFYERPYTALRIATDQSEG